MLKLRSRSRGSAWRSGAAVLHLLFALLLAAPALRAQAAPDPPTGAAGSTGSTGSTPAANDPAVADLRREIDELKQTYQQRIDELEKRLAEIEAKSAAEPTAPGTPAPEAPVAPPTPPDAAATEATPPPMPETPPAPPAEAPTEPATGSAGAGQSSTYFNPSISVIGNFLAVGGQNRTEGLPSASLRESEVGLQAIVDPYARADFFLSFGEEGVDVEEGFVTFTSLPAGLLAKVGRVRTAFGKVNTLHLHVLPWPDEPLMVGDILGSDEGWIGTGVSVARLIPLPADTFSELTLQLFRADSEGLFADPDPAHRGRLAFNSHYRLFRDLTDATNLDLGLSYAQGPNPVSPDDPVRLQAVDATYRWKPLQTGSYRSATFRGELFRSRREQPGPDPGTALGWFLSGDWQLAKRWFVGGRVEASDHADDPQAHDKGLAALLTFWPSEFSQLRGELRRREYSTGITADEFLLQLQFAIGAHGAHPF